MSRTADYLLELQEAVASGVLSDTHEGLGLMGFTQYFGAFSNDLNKEASRVRSLWLSDVGVYWVLRNMDTVDILTELSKKKC